MPEAKGKAKKDTDTESISSEKKDSGASFDVYHSEAITFQAIGEYRKSINSYTKALELRPGDKNCLVARSQCYLQLGDAEKALADADETLKEDKHYIKGFLQKAEALYLKGDFEFALVFYHRGHKLRPEVQGFRLGIQKCQEAIENSIGEKSNVRLEVKGDLSFLVEDQQKGKTKGKQYNKQLVKKDEKKERRPRTVRDPKTCKQLLGELYADKEYLEKFLKEMEQSSRKTEPLKACETLVYDCLDYLDSRTEFWQQQKPTYSRQRDQKMRDDARQRAKDDPTAWVLKQLEEIDEAQAQGQYEKSLKQAKRVLKEVNEWSDDDLANRHEVIANLHSLIGNAHLELGKYGEALKYHQEDLDNSTQHESDDGKSRALDNLGRVYARMGKFEKAIEVWEEKLPMSKSALESTWLYHEIGRCYLELNKLTEAREYGEKSNAEAETANDNTWKLNSCVLVGQALVKQEEFNSALEWFQKSLEIAKAIDDKPAQTAIQKAIDDANKRITKTMKESRGEAVTSPQPASRSASRQSDADEQARSKSKSPNLISPRRNDDEQEHSSGEEEEKREAPEEAEEEEERREEAETTQ